MRISAKSWQEIQSQNGLIDWPEWVLFATAFYQSLSKLMQFVMTQIAKLRIVRKKGWRVHWAASLQFLYARNSSQHLRFFCVPPWKELRGIQKDPVQIDWRRAENQALHVPCSLPSKQCDMVIRVLLYNSHWGRRWNVMTGDLTVCLSTGYWCTWAFVQIWYLRLECTVIDCFLLLAFEFANAILQWTQNKL